MFCPYYDSRLFLLRSIGGAGLVHNRERELDRSRAHDLKVKQELDNIILRFEQLLKPGTELRRIPLGWPRKLILSVVNRQTGMVDLDDEATRVRQIYDAVSRLKTAAGAAVREARLLSELLDREVSNVTHKGTPMRVWDHAFIEGTAELYRVLTGVEPTRSEIFYSFVKAAYQSVDLHTDPSRQIKIVLSKSRERTVQSASSVIMVGNGAIFKRKKS